MKIKTSNIVTAICLSIIPLLAWLLLFGISSCEFMRKAQRSYRDTTSVSKTNEAATKVDSSTTNKSSVYEKTTYVFPPSDTTVINNYFPAYPAMPRPTVITVEKGAAQEQTNTFNYETLLRWKIDSLAASQKNSVVTTKAEVLGFWNFFAIGAVLILALLIWIKIVKK